MAGQRPRRSASAKRSAHHGRSPARSAENAAARTLAPKTSRLSTPAPSDHGVWDADRARRWTGGLVHSHSRVPGDQDPENVCRGPSVAELFLRAERPPVVTATPNKEDQKEGAMAELSGLARTSLYLDKSRAGRFETKNREKILGLDRFASRALSRAERQALRRRAGKLVTLPPTCPYDLLVTPATSVAERPSRHRASATFGPHQEARSACSCPLIRR